MAVGPSNWAGLYQQRPVAMEGNLFKADMFEYSSMPERFDFTFVMADTAYSSKQEADYTCFTAFGVRDNELYVVDVFRKRIQASEIETAGHCVHSTPYGHLWVSGNLY